MKASYIEGLSNLRSLGDHEPVNDVVTAIGKRVATIDSNIRSISDSISAINTAINNGNKVMRLLKGMQQRTDQAILRKSSEKREILNLEHQKDKVLVDELVRSRDPSGIKMLKVSPEELGMQHDSLVSNKQIILARKHIQTRAMPKVKTALAELCEMEKKLQAKKFFAQNKFRELQRGINSPSESQPY